MPASRERGHLGHHVVERLLGVEHHADAHGASFSVGLRPATGGGRTPASGPDGRPPYRPCRLRRSVLRPDVPCDPRQVGQNARHVRCHHHGKFIRRVDHGRRRPDPPILRVPVEVRVLSAHRTPDDTIAFARAAAGAGIKVIIAAAGGAAHLAGWWRPPPRCR